MSDRNNNGKNLNYVSKLIAILILTFTIISISYILLYDSEDDSNTSESYFKYDTSFSIVDNVDDITNIRYLVNKTYKSHENTDCYIRANVGEDSYLYYMYNSNGENLVHDSDSTILAFKLNNGKAFTYDITHENMYTGTANVVDIFGMIRTAFSLDGVNIYERSVVNNETNDKGHEYIAEIVGRDKIYEMYSKLSDISAESMTDMVCNLYENWEPHIYICCYVSDDSFSNVTYGYCNYIVDDCILTSWIYDYSDELPEWRLPEQWYEYDFNLDDGTGFTEIAEETIQCIQETIEKYVEDNNIDLEVISEGE